MEGGVSLVPLGGGVSLGLEEVVAVAEEEDPVEVGQQLGPEEVGPSLRLEELEEVVEPEGLL